MSTLFPAPRPTLPGFLRHRCDSKSALGWAAVWAVAHRECAWRCTPGLLVLLEAENLWELGGYGFIWVEWGVITVGYSLQSWPGEWAAEEGSELGLGKCPQESEVPPGEVDDVSNCVRESHGDGHSELLMGTWDSSCLWSLVWIFPV